MKKRETFFGHLLALACVVVWGTTFIVSKRLLTTYSPAQVMFLRFVLAYLMLWALHPRWHFVWREELGFLLMSLFSNTLYFMTENTALTLTQASNVSILVSTAPILTAVLLAVFHRDERLSRNTVLGFLAAFAGVVLVVCNGALVLKISPLGDLLALAAALCWAIYGLILKRYTGKFNSFLISRKQMFYGILTAIPILLAEHRPMDWAGMLTPANLASIGYLALIGSALCYVAWNASVQSLGVLKTNFYLYAIPLVTMAAAAVALDERVTLMGGVGAALIIGGMVLSSLQGRKK